MADILGNLIFLDIGGNIVAGLTSKSIQFDQEYSETTDQQSSGGWRTGLAGYKGGKINVQGFYDEAATEGAQTAFVNLSNGSTITWKFGEDSAGAIFFTGSAIVSALQISGNGSSPADYTFDLQVSGKPTRSSAGF